jgi:threonine dehydrogenase-like Zn-dependent dehydrogenase
MIGVLIVQVLRAKGATNVIAVDVDRESSRSHGGWAPRNGRRGAVRRSGRRSRAHRRTWRRRVVRGGGQRRHLLSAIRCLRKGGATVLVGNLSPRVELPLQEVVSREIDVLGSCASSGEIPESIDLLARGAVDVDPIISLKAPLDEGRRSSTGCIVATRP